MKDSVSRRRILALGVLGLTSVSGCLQDLRSDGTATTTPSSDTPTTDSSTASPEQRPDSPSETAGTESEPAREISGPSSVAHTFVDSRNRMAQGSATAPASAPTIDWRSSRISNLNTRIFSTPIVAEETIVVSPTRDLVAYSRDDGTLRWRLSESAIDSYSTVVGVTYWNGAVLFAGVNDRTREWELVAVDATDGTNRWTAELPVGSESRVRAMTADGDRAVVVTGATHDAETPSANLVVFDLSDRSVRSTAELADTRLNAEDVALADETLVVTTDEAPEGTDNVVAFDLARSERTWSRRLRIGESVPVLGEEHVYLPTDVPVDESGFSGLRALSRTDGSDDWRFELQSPPRTGVTVDTDGVYVVGGNTLYGIDRTTGDPIWSYTPDGDPHISGSSSPLPVATDDHLLLGSGFGADRGVVRAVEKGAGALAWSVELQEPTAYSPFVVGDRLYTLAYSHDSSSGSLYALQ